MLTLLIMSIFSGVRPFGVSLLVAGWDDDRPYLFQCDPSVSPIILFFSLSNMAFNKTWSTIRSSSIYMYVYFVVSHHLHQRMLDLPQIENYFSLL